MTEERGPFSLGELSSLEQAREADDVRYLKSWSKAAVRRYKELATVKEILNLPAKGDRWWDQAWIGSTAMVLNWDQTTKLYEILYGEKIE